MRNLQSALVLGVVICAIGFFFSPSASLADDRNANRNVDIRHPAVIQIAGEMEDQNEFLDCGALPTDKSIKLSIRIENHSAQSLRVKLVHRSCGCIKIDLPDEPLEPGKAVLMGVTLEIEPTIQEVDQRFWIGLDTEGPRKSISANITLSLSNHLSFMSQRLHWICPERSGPNELKIPVLASSDTKLEEFDIELENELVMVRSCRLVREKDRTYMVGTIASNLVTKNVAGNIHIVRKRALLGQNRVVSICLVELTKAKWFEVLPTTLAFRPKSPQDQAVREAVGVIRIRTETKELADLRKLKCESSDGVELACSFKKIRDGYYRLTIETEKDRELPSGTQLKITGTTPNGTSSVVVQAVIGN